MGYSRSFKYKYAPRHRALLHLTLSFLFLLNHLWFTSAGRTLRIPLSHSQEEKAILRGQIGSRPPRCERRCSSCGHCEAIQVPTNPQIKAGRKGSNSTNTTTTGWWWFTIAYSRSDDNSNYKPMSWKCKCGNFIFNP